MVDEVAHRLARLAGRELQTGDDDPVFASPLSGHLDPSALRRRFVAAVTRAGLRVLPSLSVSLLCSSSDLFSLRLLCHPSTAPQSIPSLHQHFSCAGP